MSFTDDASGPMVGLLPRKDVEDLGIITSFNTVVPQFEPPQLEPVHGLQPAPMTPPVSIVPPGNFTPLGPDTASEAPVIRIFTPSRTTRSVPRTDWQVMRTGSAGADRLLRNTEEDYQVASSTVDPREKSLHSSLPKQWRS
jgi:hypothetical protein